MNIEYTKSGETLSHWERTESFVPHDAEMWTYCDVVVVGAGIAGLSTAYELSKAGYSVTVLDMNPLFIGQSGRTTAHLTSVMDEFVHNLIDMHGQQGATLLTQSHQAAIDNIERIINLEKIDCDFERLDAFLVASHEHGEDTLRKELKAYEKVGIRDVVLETHSSGSPFISRPRLRFSNQAQFHPVKYMNGLAAAIEAEGGRIHLRKKVEEIKKGDINETRLASGEVIRSEYVVVATNSPINDRFAMHTKQAPYRSYAITATMPKDAVIRGLFYDTEDPYHYVRMINDEKTGEQLLLIGGEDHKTGQDSFPEKHFENLEQWARAQFPFIGRIVDRWSGQVWESADQVQFIGRNPGDQNIFIVTGDTGQGMTMGSIAGMLIPNLVMGKGSPWEKVFDPSRKVFSAAREFIRENLNVAMQYTDYLMPGEVDDIDDIPRGEGAIVQDGLSKVACFRSETGVVTQLSAVCPHLGGMVHWNSVEKSWDCPCHGSRFKATGEVITGPSHADLEPHHEGSPQMLRLSDEMGLSPS